MRTVCCIRTSATVTLSRIDRSLWRATRAEAFLIRILQLLDAREHTRHVAPREARYKFMPPQVTSRHMGQISLDSRLSQDASNRDCIITWKKVKFLTPCSLHNTQKADSLQESRLRDDAWKWVRVCVSTKHDSFIVTLRIILGGTLEYEVWASNDHLASVLWRFLPISLYEIGLHPEWSSSSGIGSFWNQQIPKCSPV